MTAHGRAIRSNEILPVHGLGEAGKDGAERQSLWDKTSIFLAALVAILGVGLIVYGFHEALQTLKMINLPVYWPVAF